MIFPMRLGLNALVIFFSAFSLSVVLPSEALSQDHLAAAEALSRSDNPDALYPLQPDTGAYKVVHPLPPPGVEGPGVYSFADACRGEVAHLIVYYQPNSRGRSSVTPTPARLLGAKIYPKQALSELAIWSSIISYLDDACPMARGLLLSRSYQPWSGKKKPLDPSMIANIGRINQRFAINLDNADEDWREVDIGFAAPKTVTEVVYYQEIGKAHAFGRSCDDRVQAERNYCPQVLRPLKNEAHICTSDDKFCLVIPQDWCLELGGRIENRNRACKGAAFTAMAGMFDLLRHRGEARLVPDKKAAWITSQLAKIGREIILLPIDLTSELSSEICEIAENPGDHFVILNILQYNPRVYHATLGEIRARRPDLVKGAESLCIANYRCLSYGFYKGSEETMKVAGRGLRSKLCSSAEDAQNYQVMLKLLQFVSNAEDALDRGQSRAAVRAWQAATRLAEDHPDIPNISNGFVERRTEIAQAFLYVLGVPVKDVENLLKQTRP